MKSFIKKNCALPDIVLKVVLFTSLLFFIFPFYKNLAQSADPNPLPSADTIENTESNQDRYRYNPAGKRDPFYSKLWKEDSAIELPKRAAIGLQKYEITEINLVGIVWGALGRKGVVETPEGKSYMINVGTPVGKHGGIVKEITEKEVVIQEFATDYLGNRVEKISLLKIKYEEKDEKNT